MVHGTKPLCAAKGMKPEERCDLATRVLAGSESASQAAREHQVSRKFIAQQAGKAKHALDQVFDPPADTPDDLLFWMPVTKSSIKQMTLGLALTCHSSERRRNRRQQKANIRTAAMYRPTNYLRRKIHDLGSAGLKGSFCQPRPSASSCYTNIARDREVGTGG